MSDLDFCTMRRMSEANPQQKDYTWGTAELVGWTSADGAPLRGILLKPEGFDPGEQYPMIVSFYEKMSDRLHRHWTPGYSGSAINLTFYVSRGYLVFVPDIPYKVGYPGESAMNAVVPGVTALVNKGFVTEDDIISFLGVEFGIPYVELSSSLIICFHALINYLQVISFLFSVWITTFLFYTACKV